MVWGIFCIALLRPPQTIRKLLRKEIEYYVEKKIVIILIREEVEPKAALPPTNNKIYNITTYL